jgi:hypothetical protein
MPPTRLNADFNASFFVGYEARLEGHAFNASGGWS